MKYHQIISDFKDKIVECFGHRVECILLTGSIARGEVRSKSDIDIWVFLDEVRYDDLYMVGEVVKTLPREPKINPQVTSIKECLLSHFAREYSPIQYKTDGIVLHGSLNIPYPNRKDFIEITKNLAVYIIMGVRHFICIDESEHSLLSKKLLKRILKPLMWTLRYKYASKTGKYYIDIEDLKKECNLEEIHMINIFENLLQDEYTTYKGEIQTILKKVYCLCEKIILEVGLDEYN